MINLNVLDVITRRSDSTQRFILMAPGGGAPATKEGAASQDFTYELTGTVPAGVTLTRSTTGTYDNGTAQAELNLPAGLAQDTYELNLKVTNTADITDVADVKFRLSVLATNVESRDNSVAVSLSTVGGVVYSMDTDSGLFAYSAASRTRVPADRWLRAQVPANAIAQSRDATNTWYLIASNGVATRIEKWINSTRTKDTGSDIPLQAADSDATDIHVLANGVLVTKKDSNKIRYYAKVITEQQTTRNTGRKIVVSGFTGRTPDYISPFWGRVGGSPVLRGYLCGVGGQYFYVPRSGDSAGVLVAPFSFTNRVNSPNLGMGLFGFGTFSANNDLGANRGAQDYRNDIASMIDYLWREVFRPSTIRTPLDRRYDRIGFLSPSSISWYVLNNVGFQYVTSDFPRTTRA